MTTTIKDLICRNCRWSRPLISKNFAPNECMCHRSHDGLVQEMDFWCGKGEWKYGEVWKKFKEWNFDDPEIYSELDGFVYEDESTNITKDYRESYRNLLQQWEDLKCIIDRGIESSKRCETANKEIAWRNALTLVKDLIIRMETGRYRVEKFPIWDTW